MISSISARLRLTALVFTGILAAACGGADEQGPPVATPSVALNHTAAPAGSPLEITYTFVVADGARFDEDYVVFVHVMDVDEERMWDNDHEPPVPTTQWKPGQTIQYTRTVFVPVFPYVGEATIRLGLYSRTRPERLPLNGENAGQNSYRVARVQLLPQTDNLLMVFKEGWHQAEVAADDAAVEWQWTKKEATLSFRNPKKSAVFYLDVDSPGMQHHGPQQVQAVLGGQVVDEFALEDEQRVLRRVELTPVQIGEAEMADLQIRVDKSWVPAQVPAAGSGDKRELGVRVFHAFVDHR